MDLSVLPALTGIVGALVGAVVAYMLPRSRPVIFISSITLSTRYSLGNTDVEINRSLLNKLSDYPIELPADSLSVSTGVTERDYINALTSTQALVKDLTREYRRVREITDRLRTIVANEDWLALEALYAREQSLIWSAIEGEFHGGNMELGTTELAGNPRARTLSTIAKGDFSVELPGIRNLHFHWAHRSGPGKSRSRAIANRLAQAFAERDRGVLIEVFDQARNIFPRIIQAGEEILAGLEVELETYQRLVVTSVIANKGRLPFAVTNHSKLTVNLAGYPIQAIPGQAKRHDEQVSDDLRLDLEAVIQTEQEDFVESMKELMPTQRRAELGRQTTSRSETRSITIDGVKTVEWVARDAIVTYELGPELQSAYKGGERTGEIAITAIVPARDPLRIVRSVKVPFRDVGDSAPLVLKKKKKLSSG